MIAVVSPEIQRGGVTVKSAYNAAALTVHGIEPQYQAIRTIDIERGRLFRFTDEEQALRVAIIGADAATQLFGTRDSIGQTVSAERHSVHRDRQDPQEGSGQQLQRSRQRQGVHAVLGDGARLSAHRRARRASSRRSSSRRSRGSSTQLPRVLDSRTGRDRGHRLAARARGPPRPGAAARLRCRRPRTPSRCGTPRSSR